MKKILDELLPLEKEKRPLNPLMKVARSKSPSHMCKTTSNSSTRHTSRQIHPSTFIFFFFFPSPFCDLPFCQFLQLPIRSSRDSSQAFSSSLFRFRASISSSSFFFSLPSSCNCAFNRRLRLASSSTRTSTVFCRHSFLNSSVFSSGESRVYLCSLINIRRASAMHSSR